MVADFDENIKIWFDAVGQQGQESAMAAINATYLDPDSSYSAMINVGKPEDTLRQVLEKARSAGERFGYGVLKVDGEVKTLADLDSPVGKAYRIEFFEREREQPVDLDSIFPKAR